METASSTSSFIGRGTQIRSACARAMWVPDRARTQCTGCGKGFSLLRRRHHCRVCGDIVCGKCSQTVYLINTRSNVGRSCPSCADATLSARTLAMHNDLILEPPSHLEKRATCPRFLDALPTLPYASAHDSCWNKDCAVCLEAFRGDTKVVQLPCHHVFHRACLFPWLASHDECPLCRHKLPRDMTSFQRFFSL
ncbi:hypothetical protein SDRG_13664 [Saprolegnia diclina VS20]|uniref:RING-type domain-containing protein n=1 Tax=Saprolegnia diclina (strain VS20) TaxID=1156394 RepID=T0R8Z2_SAPDV|nr:hypothetical protein SDRG_13664 [Saprolegnia diclina VS20]EQC28588.1 hypothetical protein SDRG_13664 [Saprolegnia diclina VS20]|eukprot:XP_008617985.1 hypothetical protein SDRG_13664 [Saprolegnia diclina VS20]